MPSLDQIENDDMKKAGAVEAPARIIRYDLAIASGQAMFAGGSVLSQSEGSRRLRLTARSRTQWQTLSTSNI